MSRTAIIVTIFVVALGSASIYSSRGSPTKWFEGGAGIYHEREGEEERAESVVLKENIGNSVVGKKITDSQLEEIEGENNAKDSVLNKSAPAALRTCTVSKDRKAGHFTNLQGAIDALPESGGVIYVREGTYDLSEKIEIRSSNISLIGAGLGTVLNQTADDFIVHVGWGAENVTIKNLKLRGTGGNPGMYLSSARSSLIRNVYIENSEVGIYLRNSEGNLIIKNIIESNEIGIKLHNSHSNIASWNLTTGNASFGIYILSSDNNSILKNLIKGNGGDGIRLRGSSNNSIIGNSLLKNGDSGIYLGYSCTNNNLVAANNLNSNRIGIRLTPSVEKTRLVMNQFSNNSNGDVQDESDSTIYVKPRDIEGKEAITADMAKDAVGSDQISSGTVASIEIRNCTIENAKLCEEKISEKNILDGAITSTKINDGAITERKIQSNAILEKHISAGAVGTDKIADGAVETEKTNPNVLQTGTVRKAVLLNMRTGCAHIDFPYEFSRTPNVVVSFANVDNKSVLPGTLFIENATSQGFDTGWALRQNGAGFADIAWYASIEPEKGPLGVQILSNPSFEKPGREGKEPHNWSCPLTLAENLAPGTIENDFVQYGDYYKVEPKEGEFMGRLYIRSAAENDWVGTGAEQKVENIKAGANLLLYNVAFLHWSGSDHSDFAGAMVEVETKSRGMIYRLRYIHGYRRSVWPKSSGLTKYIDVQKGKEMPWREWVSIRRDLNRDLVNEFENIGENDGFIINSIKLYALLHKMDAAETKLFIGWDDIKLVSSTH